MISVADACVICDLQSTHLKYRLRNSEAESELSSDILPRQRK